MYDEYDEMEEKREFLRVDYETPLKCKVLGGERFTSKPDIFSQNISACGLLFRTISKSSIPALSSVVWIDLDEKMMNVCTELENDLAIYKNGVLGRVVRIAEGEPGKSYDIGVCFLKKDDNITKDIEESLKEK